MINSVNEVFNKLQGEGYNISLLDCSEKEEGNVWVAYVIGEDEKTVNEIRETLKETGMLMYPADDLIEQPDELYSMLKCICKLN